MYVWSPNITGLLKRGSGVQPFAGPEGAFSLGTTDARFANQGETGSFSSLLFDASRSSTLYGGSTMQPNALQVLACIRV